MGKKEKYNPIQRKGWRGYLSPNFFNNLTKGSYLPLIQTIINDNDLEKGLDIQLRNNYLNIYYNGGNILRITPERFHFDKYYFYIPKSKEFPLNYHKSHIEKVADGKLNKISQNVDNSKIPPVSTAKEYSEKLNKMRDALLDELKKEDFENYFNKAKTIMDKWEKRDNEEQKDQDKAGRKDQYKIDKAERKDQHKISLANKEFESPNSLIVLDIEFSTSKDPSHHSYNHTNKNCRFDIIALDNKGQIFVIELKENPIADRENKGSNIDSHKKDFDNSIGQDSKKEFLEEMKGLLKVKQELGLLKSEIEIDERLNPIFAIAYSGEDSQSFYKKHSDLPAIKLDENYKLLK